MLMYTEHTFNINAMDAYTYTTRHIDTDRV